MLGRLRNSFAEIDLVALEYNYKSLKGALKSNVGLIPMVKADAYGHGAVPVARVCERLGARFLGVALIEEGIALRLAGIQVPILVFSIFDTMGIEAMIQYRLTPVVSTFHQIQKLKEALHDTASYPVHVKFNTSMQRLGFEPSAAKAVAAEFEKESFLKLEGVCTHLASSEDFGQTPSATESHLDSFNKIKTDIQGIIQYPILFHHMNSAAILSHLEPQFDLARPGISLYGALPKLNIDPALKVKPVMSVKSFVGLVHNVKKADKVSYGGTWQAKKDSVVAVVPMGYADGIPRSLSNKGRVIIKGEFCPMIGIVCMDYFMVDVTHIAEKDNLVGSEVVFLGSQNSRSIFAEEVAQVADTIPYEILTGIQGRLPRIYIH
jgi:alanine racemase